MPSKQIQDLTKLDSKLDKIEKQFNKKLENYYSQLESDTLKQVSKYKPNKEIKIAASKQTGLENLFKNHFKNVEKLSTEYTKRELAGFTNSPDELEKIRLLSVSKTNKANIEYAKKLSEKQVSDYQEKVKDKLSDALKDNPKLSAKELKDLVKHETQSFKNVRVSATSSTEALRVTNETKLELYKKMDIKKVKFIATLDRRTSEFCRAHNAMVYDIGKQPVLPNHVHCRSYYLAIKKVNK